MKKNILSVLLALSVMVYSTVGHAEDARIVYVKGRFGAVLTDKNPSSVVNEMFDYDSFVRSALGIHNDEVSNEEREILTYLVGKIVSNSLGKRLGSMKGLSVSWNEAVSDEGGDSQVTSNVRPRGSKTDEFTEVTYVVRSHGGSYRVTDIIIDDVSTTWNYRSQFHKIIVKGGVKGLIEKMAKKAGVAVEDFGC